MVPHTLIIFKLIPVNLFQIKAGIFLNSKFKLLACQRYFPLQFYYFNHNVVKDL